MVVGALTGMDIVAACPEGFTPDPELVAWADAAARERGGAVRVVRDPLEAVADARGLFTDTWVSMGDEGAEEERRAVFEPYRIDDALLDRAGPGAVALHCLPAHHGEEITYEVLHGPARRSGTRRRTGCTPRPPCSRTCWGEDGRLRPADATTPCRGDQLGAGGLRAPPARGGDAGRVCWRELEIPVVVRRTTIDVPDMLAGGPRELLVPADRALEARALLDPQEPIEP